MQEDIKARLYSYNTQISTHKQEATLHHISNHIAKNKHYVSKTQLAGISNHIA